MTKKFDKDNAVLSYHIYMWNTWCQEECAKIFNNPGEDWKYSLGEHFWNKWCGFCKDIGSTGAPSMMVVALDETNLNKLIDRACELYDGRKNRK